MRHNPLSLGRSYFPPWDSGLAYHAITSGAGWDDVEHYFRLIWESQWILSARSLGTRGAVMDLDVLAGDDENVFLSISQPLSFQQDLGYYFVFDANKLVRGGAKVGVVDLLDGYQDALADAREEGDWRDYEHLPPSQWSAGVYARFLDLVKLYQENLRFSGRDAQRWVDWCMGGSEPRDLVQSTRDFLDDMESQINVPWNLTKARMQSEILVKDHLDLDARAGLRGVCFRHIYFELEDFYRIFTGARLEELNTDLGDDCYKLGYPYRCPFCKEPLVPWDSSEYIFSSRPWVEITIESERRPAVPCRVCEGYLLFGEPMGRDRAATEDVFLPFGDVDVSDVRGLRPARCY